MIILGIESSAKAASAAICTENKVLGEFTINTGLTHSQTIMPMANALLKNSQIDISQVDAFAVSQGPGSFTGLRIGIAAVKGMAMAANKPCIGVSTLGALARNMRGTDGIICPVMDARCSQVYTAIFKGEGNNVSRLTDDMAIKIDELEKKLEEYNMPIFFVGDGADLCYNSISKKIASVHKAAENRVNQSAASVCALAFEIIKREEDALVSAGELVPCYLRLPQAERELRKKNENK